MRGSASARCGLAFLGVIFGALACDRSKPPPAKPVTPPAAAVQDRVTPPAEKPDYTFAAGLAERYPEVVSFMRHVLETCLAGDYAGYRLLVARSADPESRARFERILHALRSARIESIEEVEVREVPPPTYLVVGSAELQADERSARHRPAGPRRIGILVLKEEDQWRVRLASGDVQLADDADTMTAPTTTSAPSYPWDEDGDY